MRIVDLKSDRTPVDEALYQALKSMTESYDLVVAQLPSGLAKSSFEGFFIGTQAPAKEAMLRFEVLKGRRAQQDNEAYRITLFGNDPTINAA